MAEKLAMISFLLSLAAFSPAFADDIPADCRNVGAYQQGLASYNVSTDHLKVCKESVAAILKTWNDMGTAIPHGVRKASQQGVDSQVNALVDTAAVAGASAETKENWSKIAATAQTSFASVADRVGADIKKLDRETGRLLSLDQVSDSRKSQFQDLSTAARKDLAALQGNARQLADEAGRNATSLHQDAGQLGQFESRNRAAADRLSSGDDRQPAADPPKKGVSTGLMVGLGGAALITAGAVGGLYWVSQKAISSANDDAAARIAQGQAAANQVIANAGATATAVITAVQTAAQQIIQFAVNSANQVIANAQAAANQIYNQAKTDLAGLMTELQSEVQSTFQNLTSAGLTELQTELTSMFQGLIARANAEGNATLAANLQGTLSTITAQIQAEIARRGGAGTGTSTASGTSTSTSTSSGTGTSTATGSSSSTSTSTSTGTHTGLQTLSVTSTAN